MNAIESREVANRKHLFISYATEDSDFADWLVLKLASEGYHIWYDRLKLLGGESYPIDITEAIKNKTFRVIALLSRNSISKPNPIKERTLALNIAKKRKIDFLIPLNIDGLKSTELDFMTSDLVYIPFHRSWFSGLRALLKKLRQVNAPRNTQINRQRITKWLSTEEKALLKKEIVWSNILPVLELPTKIRKYKFVPEIDVESFRDKWVFLPEGHNIVWAFNPPELTSVDWLSEMQTFSVNELQHLEQNIKRIFFTLIRKAIENYCINKGLIFNKGSLFFPNNLVQKNRVYFLRYDGKKTFVKVVGERTFRISIKKEYFYEKSRYHLSPVLKFVATKLNDPVIKLRIRIYWTDLDNFPLESKKANRRRKALCKNWWNYEWLSRNLAVLQWLSEGKDEITVLKTTSGNFRLGMKPLSFTSKVGIDEESLKLEKLENKNQIVDECDEGNKICSSV